MFGVYTFWQHRSLGFLSINDVRMCVIVCVLVAGCSAETSAHRESRYGPAAPREIKDLHVDGSVNAVAFDGGGSRLAVLSNYGTKISLFDTHDWSLVKQIKRIGSAYAFNSLAYLPDNTLVTSTPNGAYTDESRLDGTPSMVPIYRRVDVFALMQWDLSRGKPVRFFPDDPARAAAPQPDEIYADTFSVSADGTKAAAVNAHGVMVLDLNTGSIIKTISVPRLSPNLGDTAMSVAFSSDGCLLAVGTMEGKLYLYDTRDWKSRDINIEAINNEYSIGPVTFSSDGRFIAIGKRRMSDWRFINGKEYKYKSDIYSTYIIDVRDGHVEFRLPGSVWQSSVGPDANIVRTISWQNGGKILLIGDDRAMKVWRFEAGKPVLELDRAFSESVFTSSFSPRGSFAIGAGDSVLVYQ